MKPKLLPSFLLLFFVAGALCSLPLRAEVPPSSPAAAALPAPPIPVVPRYFSFADRVAGRHLLFDMSEAYQTSPAVSFTARWNETETNAPGTPDSRLHGTETFKAELNAGRIALVSDSVDAGDVRTVRHTFCIDGQLTATYFQQHPSNGKNTPLPKRELTQISLDEGVSLPRAFQALQIDPATRAAHLLLTPNVVLRGSSAGGETPLWREAAPVLIDGMRADVVNEVEIPESEGGGRRFRARRYCIDPVARRLLRYEEWQVSRNPDRARPARKNRPADDGTRVQYRREEYGQVALSAVSLPVSTFSQTVPAGYVLSSRANFKLPPAETTLAADAYAPKSLALLERWRRSQMRLLSLKTEIEATVSQTERTDVSRPIPDARRGSQIHYLVTIEKPAFARIAGNVVSGGSGGRGRPQTQTAISDGRSVRVVTDGDIRTAPMQGNGEALWNRLNRAGIRDGTGALAFLLTPPPDAADYDRAAYDGPSVLPDGEPVEGITLTRSVAGKARRARDAETSLSLKILFGRDGLPRQIEHNRVTDIQGLYAGDQPPKQAVIIRYYNMTLDSEPSASAFTLPTP